MSAESPAPAAPAAGPGTAGPTDAASGRPADVARSGPAGAAGGGPTEVASGGRTDVVRSGPAGVASGGPADADGGAACAAERTPLHRWVRGLVGRSVGAGRPGTGPTGALGPLVGMHLTNRPVDADIPTLERAFAVAEKHHRGQRRKSGEPFITHPLAVATILADLGLDTTTLAAALLHDTVEDTGYTITETQAEFGLEVAHLVDGVTKLDKVRFGDDAEAETIRKMVVAAGRDLRVLVIKLADRLHNMRTLRYQPPHKQQRTARATQDVLVPLADRLGIGLLKRELEGLCFAVLQPAEAATTARLDRERAPRRAALAATVARELAPELRAGRIPATVRAHPRHPYSAYRTSRERGGRGDQLLDAARVLVLVGEGGTPGDCYAALGLVHGRWRPVPGRFKDHIAVPKFNLYQSLHTTVLGPGGEPLDVLIRTEAMHLVAEHGIAAQLRASSAPGIAHPFGVARSREMEWLRRLLAWQREVADAGEFIRTLRDELGGGREVLVFATGGQAVTLPEGATPVDLAYALGGTVGHRTIGARANGKLVPLTIPLAEGDRVEILTSESENPGPSRDWLTSVRTPHALVRIQQWFTEQSRDVVIERGRHALEVAFSAAERSLEDAVEDGSLLVTALEGGHRQLDELFAAVAERRVTPDLVVARATVHAPPG